MEHFEKEALRKKALKKPEVWFRYVDDIIRDMETRQSRKFELRKFISSTYFPQQLTSKYPSLWT